MPMHNRRKFYFIFTNYEMKEFEMTIGKHSAKRAEISI